MLGQAVVVENRGGASGNIGAQAVAKAEPDGYTLLAMISSHVMNPFVLKSVPYDIDHDFAMISRTVTAPEVLVGNPSLPAKDLKELLAYMKANPGKVAFGSAGVGSLSHLIVELFEQDAGVKLLHVPYRGTQPAFNDVLGGQVAIMMPDLTIALSNIQSGNVRAYGVTSAARSPAAPDLPTVAEAGLPGFEAVQWFGLAAPAGTPKDIVDQIACRRQQSARRSRGEEALRGARHDAGAERVAARLRQVRSRRRRALGQSGRRRSHRRAVTERSPKYHMQEQP